ncbi:MAG: hypothetical protein CR982_02780 [Candidatus Cloacimonadota bacterium]|nr:MAG: hypothetical protein CR982_02780 [Candidatus Cloacimonadota bacterium]PIE79195.1 MAG: hypothetical protein CSA15_03975 [Candidatus Delongbacteria bacterium]
MKKGIIDIHTHILFGVDDGAKNIENSMDIIKAGMEEGVDHFFLTPHFYTLSQFNQALVNKNFETLKEKVKDLDITLNLAAEIHLSYDILQISFMEKFRLNKSTILLEFPFSRVPINYPQVLQKMIDRNINFVIAHPERIEDFRKDFKHVERLKDLGCKFQVTAGSVVGKFGFFIRRFAHKLIKNNMCDYIASDVHNLRARKFYIKEAYDLVSKKYGETLAEDLFINNQKKYILGE